jgi:hypothetical protein
MNKIDLIIDALESCKETSWSMIFDAESVQEALAAARELRALKPVGEIVCEDLGKPFNAMQIRMHFYDFAPSIGTKLYALDEVKHD